MGRRDIAAQDREGDTRMARPEPGPLARLRAWARAVRRDVMALWLAARDPRTPWLAKAVCAAIAAYALSPIDLIPDVIPVLGLLDEVILLPPLILLAVRLVPPDLMAELREEAARRVEHPVSRMGAAMVVGLWILALVLIAWAAAPAF
jgi:uncharacterized membrane protein YkvA (DUF1232 family)